jgi:hypothetical protein
MMLELLYVSLALIPVLHANLRQYYAQHAIWLLTEPL